MPHRAHPLVRRVAITVLMGMASWGVHDDWVCASEVLAGVARSEFTLPRHVPLAGYSRRKGRPSTGVHDPVGVRALVLEEGETTAALVSCDLLLIDEHLFDAVRSRLAARGLPSRLVLVLTATHTHSGPGAYGTTFFEKISMGHYDPRVFEQLVDRISQTVLEARAQRGPIRIAYGAMPTEGLVKNRVTPDGRVDAELALCALYRPAAAQPLAVLVNFSAHPTTLGAWNRDLSADYPGVIVEEVERRRPGTMCLFVAGSVGDQAPVKSGSGFERAQVIGQPIAQRVLGWLEQAIPEAPGFFDALQARVMLPPARVRLNARLALPGWASRRLVDDDATLSAVRVGRVMLLGAPCDLTAELGAQLKAAVRAKGMEPVIMGFASDYIGYCVTDASYATAQYEALMAFNGPQAGTLVVDRLIHMMDDSVGAWDRRQGAGVTK